MSGNTQTKQVNWGIVSAGRIAEKFCEDMQYVKNGRLAAIAARSIQSAVNFAEKFQIERAYAGYQCLFDDPEIDVIYIATTHNFHFQHAKAALLAGKSVLCEKPITVSVNECVELQTIAKQKNVFLMEALWTYFLPSVLQAKQWAEQGLIGKIKHIKADFGYQVPYDAIGRMYNPELAGGCLFDMGIYPLAISHYFNPAPLSEIAIKVKKAESGVEDDLVILAKAGDVTLSLATSFQCRLQNAALIIGEDGYIKIPDFWRAKSCSLHKMDTKIDEFIDSEANLGYCHEANAVGEMILQNCKEHPFVPHSTSLALQQQLEAIRTMF
ncbi:Gfo/Idh/MocA family oxidoreductase [Aliiglaciecola sp. 3_MG-2023]|uniref:Gfo/Idh/MocA family protein n=1 Tax=Aliiglaciecola sp. 3_MG-2023 TaxID=3062644 RepID=UPI0026E26E5D|nr:Gfo/Idh/MocA family oxidoreductase [Aliiglaciecola sp. 3_MG-2023]MDO6695319.1 Gfo/Idh/MocA family oxidoreductase [Aliiglaciecola sp. 3_MG-2023]